MSQKGFTYIETIAALTLLGLAILAASSMTAAHPVASARLAAHEEMLRSLDAVLEGVRAGTIPARSGPVVSPIPTSSRMVLGLEIEGPDAHGLVRVRATARAVVRGRTVRRELRTAIWSSS